MNFKKCVYYVEGSCEEQLINALKMEPRKMIPGKVKVFNIIQNEIPRREVNMITTGTLVVFVFDTDVNKTDVLKKNLDHVKKYAAQVKIVYLAQVLNFEDELVRATGLKKVHEMTKSKSLRDFKSDFCQMKTIDCRHALDRHHLDVSKLWSANPPVCFSFISQNGNAVKI